MTKYLGNSFAQIRYKDQEGHAGCGFLIDSNWLITCTHVLEQVNRDAPLKAGMTFTIDLPFLGQKGSTFELADHYPVMEGNVSLKDLEDMALLKIKDDSEWESVPVLKVKFPDYYDQNDHSIAIYSPKANDYPKAMCKSVSREGYLILGTDIPVEPGDSGAPVWNNNLEAITGMLVARRKDRPVCYVIPTVKILEGFKSYLPDMAKQEYEGRTSSLSQIKERIAEELSMPGVEIFTDELRLQLNKVLVKLQYHKEEIKENRSPLIAEALVWAMANGEEDVPVITTVLMNAFMHCFHRRKGRRSNEARPHHREIKDAVEQLLGWLVLASIDEEKLSYVASVGGKDNSAYFELPVETQGGVEVIVSHQHQRAANMDSSGSEVVPPNMTRVTADQFEWKDTSTVDTLKLMLWNKLFPEEHQETVLTVDQVKKLNAEILIRRKDEWDKEHHYIAIQCNELDGKNVYFGVYKELLADLDNLSLVRFGVLGKGSVFFTLEHNLMQSINRFLQAINKMED